VCVCVCVCARVPAQPLPLLVANLDRTRFLKGAGMEGNLEHPVGKATLNMYSQICSYTVGNNKLLCLKLMPHR